MPSRRRWIAVALGLAALAALGAVPALQNPYQLLVYTRFLLLALMAQGWNFIGGYAGYPAFGNVGFFGIGAYGTGLLMLSGWQIPFFPALAAGAVLAAAVAVLIGLAVLRLKGHYFAIATLGVAEALREIGDCWDAWIAIREDQEAARSMGIDTTRAKVIAFALSAVFAALAGGVTAYQNIHVTPTDFFKIDYTLEMIICCIIGGTGTVLGPLVGAAIYQLLSTTVWQHFLALHPTVLGAIIIVFVVFLPRGLMQIVDHARRIASGERRFRWRDLLANVRSHRVT